MTNETQIRIALGELGATWEDPEMVIQNVMDIFHQREQQIKEELLREIEKEDWECFEQTMIVKDIKSIINKIL